MKILRNILAVIFGLLLGGSINMGIILISGSIIPPPEGAIITTAEGLKESMHLFTPINFLMPFLAHAIGTLVGAIISAKIAANNKIIFALVIGTVFFTGGVMMTFQVPSPTWFTIVDLIGAYIPMAWLGWKIAGGNK